MESIEFLNSASMSEHGVPPSLPSFLSFMGIAFLDSQMGSLKDTW